MRIFAIIYKELLEGIRDVKTLVIMILMPTILTILLAIIFNDSFIENIELNDVQVELLNYNSYSNNNTYIGLVDLLSSYGLKVKILRNVEDSNLKDSILIKFIEPKRIDVYYDDKNNIYGKSVAVICNKYFKESELMRNIPSFTSIKTLELDEGTLIISKSLENNNPSSSLDHFGVTMVVLSLMFSSVTGAYKIIKERESRNIDKLLTIPLNFKVFLIGKLVGSLFISLIQILLVLFISNRILNVNWGSKIGLVLLLLLSASSLSISIGILLGNFIRDNKSCWMILLSLIMTWGLIGGAFMPLDLIQNPVVNNISLISPVTYIIRSIFDGVYLNQYNLMIYTIAFFFIGSLFIINLSGKVMVEI